MNINSNDFIMSPKVDFAFKEVMMNKKAHIGFLSAVLKIKPESIVETQILNPYLKKEGDDSKQGILDVRIKLNNNVEIDIEMQVIELKVWAERSLFYLSRMYTEQLKKGESYDKLKKCISISVLGFNLFDDEEFYSSFHIREDKRNFVLTDKMEFHIIELKKVPEELNDDLALWSKFINAESKEEFEMLASKNPYIKEAYNQLELISQDEKKRMEYTARQKTLSDYVTIVEQNYNDGYKIGQKKGEKIGQERGEKIGREQGEKIGQERGEKIGQEIKSREIAKNLLDVLDIEIIAMKTGLSVEEIKELRED